MAELKTTTPKAQEVLRDETALEALRASLRGTMLRAGDEGYEEARRLWNGMIDRHPALVVRCSGTADVIHAMRFAREHRIPVAVRGGGHNVAGNALCDGGLVIDLSLMRSVRVDPEKRRVRAAGGARLGDIDHETQAFGLAVPLGVASATGVAGLTLHGGIGFLMRKYGLSADNLVAADVVTADGRLLLVDEHNHAELLWALKGGGGNFGVVTSFEFRLHPVGPQVWMALAFYPPSRAREILAFYQDLIARAPDELTAGIIFWNAPTEEPIPEAYRGAPVVVLAGCYCGPLDQGERAIQPLRAFDGLMVDLSGPIPFLTAQQLFDPDYPDGRRYYWKSVYLRDLSDRAVQALIDYGARRPSPLSTLEIWALGGAVGRVKPQETAFAKRDAPYLVAIESNWIDPTDDEANIAWAREASRALQPFSSDGTYLNFPGFGEEGETLVKASYGDNYARLQAIKAKYDPDNVFRHTLNIPPS